MLQDEILYSIALRATPNIGDINFMKLIDAAGSAKEAWLLSKKLLKEIPGFGSKIIKNIGNDEFLKFAENELIFCEKNNIKIKLRHQNQLPKLLSQCDDAPAILYQKGDFDDNLIPISIVGTRNMTNYGREFVEEFITSIKNKNILIVSGLALGTDGQAHAEALKNNIPTVGVLAHGLHLIYPSQHRKLAQEMIENGGAIISEFNSTDKPDREHFLQRNRIVAGFSSITIVVETAFGGGSMSTVSYANGYNREVYALPGKISDKYSQGCNLIISQNKARIISKFQDILDDLGIDKESVRIPSLFETKTIKLNKEAQPIYDCIAENIQISLDDLSEKLEIPPFKLLPILLDLELKSYIKALSGKQYRIS
jgi:DNA processing protein